MKKKILSTIFTMCACACLVLGLTACGGGSEESDPIKYAQSVLSKYGQNYDYVYECPELAPDDYGFLDYKDFYYYVSTGANKTTITRTKYVDAPDTKDARAITDYYEVTPNGENVNVFHYDVNGLTYTTNVLTKSEYQKAFPYLVENVVNVFASFDPDNPNFDTDDQYFKREDTRVYEKRVDDNKITLENTCNYYIGSPSENERDKEHPDPNFKGTDTLGYTMQIDKKTGHILNIDDDYTNQEIEYSYNSGTKSIDTKYYAATKKEAVTKVLNDMTYEAPTGNYKMEGTVKQSNRTDSVVAVYDAEKGMTKSVSGDTVAYQKIVVNGEGKDPYATMTSYSDMGDRHYKYTQNISKEEYQYYANDYFSLAFDLTNIAEENIEIVHDVEDNTTLITITDGENVTTITFESGNKFSVARESTGMNVSCYYTNHKLARLVTEITAAYPGAGTQTTDVTYTYDNVAGFDFDESLYTEATY